jgi:hypothetical protein
MKRFLPLMAMCALFLSLLQPARGADLSINLFYDNLSGGNWYEVADYGYVWQPDVASDANWRPYTDGYWAYTDQGWTWVSYEDFGWATYHYGRWARLADYGWVWVPGYEWAPAWVSWRTGGNYVGWAPLPPAGGGEVVYEGRPITGHVDVEFGIGPACYNFIDVRYIGEPILRDRIYDYNQNVTYIGNTVNVTNITYNKSVVYSYGPDYATVSRYSVRPIQRLKLQRQTGDPSQAIKSGNITKVQGNTTLVVAAPQKLQKATGVQIAPKQVKARIEQPKVEKGWANTDANEKTKLEQKFKTENAKNIPKPDIQPNAGNANEATGAASPAERARKGEKLETTPSHAPVVAASPNAAEQQGKGGRNKNRSERAQASPVRSAAAAGENQPANARAGEGNKNRGKRHEGNVAPAAAVTPQEAAKEQNELEAKPETANANPAHARKDAQGTRRNDEQRGAQERRHEQVQNAPGANPPAVGVGAGGGRQHREETQGNQQGKQQRGEQGAAQLKGKGKEKKSQGEATPPPQ